MKDGSLELKDLCVGDELLFDNNRWKVVAITNKNFFEAECLTEHRVWNCNFVLPDNTFKMIENKRKRRYQKLRKCYEKF